MELTVYKTLLLILTLDRRQQYLQRVSNGNCAVKDIDVEDYSRDRMPRVDDDSKNHYDHGESQRKDGGTIYVTGDTEELDHVKDLYTTQRCVRTVTRLRELEEERESVVRTL